LDGGTISFRHEPLENIAAKLERWYNVQIIFDQPDIKDIQFSGSVLRNKPIDQILEVLTFISGIGYQMETRNNQPNYNSLKASAYEEKLIKKAGNTRNIPSLCPDVSGIQLNFESFIIQNLICQIYENFTPSFTSHVEIN
jgi:hypothetical protein